MTFGGYCTSGRCEVERDKVGLGLSGGINVVRWLQGIFEIRWERLRHRENIRTLERILGRDPPRRGELQSRTI